MFAARTLDMSVFSKQAVFPGMSAESWRSADLFGTLASLRRELEELRLRERLQATALARLEEEVERAARLQRKLLDSRVPAVAGAEIAAFSRAARGVSGDFHELTRIDADRVAMVIGDATGHGVAAGLLSTLIRGSLGGRRRSGDAQWACDPAAALSAMNRDLLDWSLGDCEFVTALCAVYDESARELSWARGGAPYPIVIRAGRSPERLRSEGMTLGVDENARFEVARITLEPGDAVVFHTDGLDAALADGRSPLSMEPMPSDWFRDLTRRGFAAQFDELRLRLDGLHDDDRRLDDVTLVALRAKA